MCIYMSPGWYRHITAPQGVEGNVGVSWDRREGVGRGEEGEGEGKGWRERGGGEEGEWRGGMEGG